MSAVPAEPVAMISVSLTAIASETIFRFNLLNVPDPEEFMSPLLLNARTAEPVPVLNSIREF